MSTLETIQGILQDKLSIDPSSVTDESTFDSLNIDSLDLVELICELEDQAGVDLGEPEGIDTIGKLVTYVDGLK